MHYLCNNLYLHSNVSLWRLGPIHISLVLEVMHCKLWDGHPWFWGITLSFTPSYQLTSSLNRQSCPSLSPASWLVTSTNLHSLWSLVPSSAPGSIVYNYLIIVIAVKDSRAAALIRRLVMCELHHQPSTAHPSLCPVSHLHQGMYNLSWQKRGHSPQNNCSPLQHPCWVSKFRNFLENTKSWAL